MNFFKIECQSTPSNRTKFGICDDRVGFPAYISENEKENWGATVINNVANEGTGYDIIFTAIDKCIINDSDFPNRQRCEGMLTTEKHLFLVELKNRSNLNSGEMLNQLISTIAFLNEFHPEVHVKFTHKKVFACNERKKGKFFVIDHETKKAFHKKYGFRIDIQTNIVVI